MPSPLSLSGAAERHAFRRPGLLARGWIIKAMRAWFEAQGFTEVETQCLQVSPGNEAHLHAFATTLLATDGSVQARLFLHTSPEFACKKLLALGEKKIFTFARVFRNRERGALHSPEFTMLEWYRTQAPYEALMQDCHALLTLAAEATQRPHVSWRGRICTLSAEPERLSLVEAFARHAGIDLERTLGQGGTPDLAALREQVKAQGLRTAQHDTWSDLFSRVLVERIEPKLGLGRPTILERYPVCEAALARPCPDDPRFAERFELYVCGVELANGFGELTDPAEQRRRFIMEMDEKQRVYGERYPLDEAFLEALAHMPPASGIALGFDRLVMLATGAEKVEEVMWTPLAV